MLTNRPMLQRDREALPAISPEQDAVLRRLVRAEIAFGNLLRPLDGKAKLAVYDRKRDLGCELRGELPYAQQSDSRRSLDEYRPTVRVVRQLIKRGDDRREKIKRMVNGCGPVQLRLGRKAVTRRWLEALLHQSRLPRRDFAHYALGVDEVTLYKYLTDGPIPGTRANYIRNIEHVARDGNILHIIIRTPAESPRWARMVREREKYVQQYRSCSVGASAIAW